MNYHLVHIITSGEYRTPLVASQLFDRAQIEAVTPGDNKPLSVSVWIVTTMRDVFDKQGKAIVEALRKRCPAVNIHMIGGIGRLGNWPVIPHMKMLRGRGKDPYIYHCRGESSADWAIPMKQSFPQDRIILDVRGFWPMERLVDANVFEEHLMTDAQKTQYLKDVDKLRHAVRHSDRVCSVSDPLADMISEYMTTPGPIKIIPCCVDQTVGDEARADVRRKLDLDGKTAILYLGGAQKHQYLEELALPFMKAALALDKNNVGVFITQNKDKVGALIEQYQLNKEQVRLLSAPQREVAQYLTGMDAGIMLRPPGRFNNMSQPVKFGEYLAAGLPVIVQKGPRNLEAILATNQAGYVVDIAGKDEPAFTAEVKNALAWLAAHGQQARTNARRFVEQQYTWHALLPDERQMYADTLK